MKRHDSLIPLTHDHHHALVQVKRLRSASDSAPSERMEVIQGFLEFYQRDTLMHFREEEETIFPLVVDREEAQTALVRLMMEHIRIHALVRDLTEQVATDGPESETMEALAGLLDAHIRFEEKTFFPLVEEYAMSDLASIALAPRDRGIREQQ